MLNHYGISTKCFSYHKYNEKSKISDQRKKLESAKNAVLPMLAASILTDEQVVIKNCPKIKDVYAMINILSSIGVTCKFENQNLIVDASGINSYYRIAFFNIHAWCAFIKI